MRICSKKPTKISLALILVIIFLIGNLTYYNVYSKVENNSTPDPLQPQIAEKILRFHVLGNSNSHKDQQVKLQVRDAIGSMMEPVLESSDSLNRSEQLVKENMPQILEVANQVLEENGFDYKAKASIKTVEFPDKTYGTYTFPAGKYEALQVILGKGSGHNWWCVLYPNMCFRGSLYEVVDDKSKEDLKEILTAEEYEDVENRKSDHWEIRFKLLEYFFGNE